MAVLPQYMHALQHISFERDDLIVGLQKREILAFLMLQHGIFKFKNESSPTKKDLIAWKIT